MGALQTLYSWKFVQISFSYYSNHDICYKFYIERFVKDNQSNLFFLLVHKAHREELEQVLQLLEKVLTLLPELLNRRWQCHSLARILQKLLHPGNSWKLRRQAIRYISN